MLERRSRRGCSAKSCVRGAAVGGGVRDKGFSGLEGKGCSEKFVYRLERSELEDNITNQKEAIDQMEVAERGLGRSVTSSAMGAVE